MIKKVLCSSVLFTSTLLSSQNYPYFINDMHGYIQKNKLDLSTSLMMMNDTVDVLNIKEGEVGSNTAASLGDLDGQEVFLRYKLYDDAMISAKYQKTNLSYGLGELQNEKIDLYIRHNFISKSFAVDFGVQINQAQDIKSSAIKNRATSAIENRDLITISNNPFYPIIPTAKPYIVTDSNGDYFKDSNGNNITIQRDDNSVKNFLEEEIIDEIGIKNMKDTTYYIRATRSFVEDEVYSKDIYVGYAYSKVDSFLDITIQQNKDLTNIVENKISQYKDLQDLSRDEHKFILGVNHSWFVNRWFMDIGYEFNYILRDKGLDTYKTNHKLSAYLGYEIFDDAVMYLGAKIMTNQYVGEIPYLYNEYTQSSFDKKYGWAKTGFIYRF